MSDAPLTEFDMKHLADKLLLTEYPGHMAAMSCSCEPEAVCGAHRLFARYEQLFDQFQATNKDRVKLRAERDTLTAENAAFRLEHDGLLIDKSDHRTIAARLQVENVNLKAELRSLRAAVATMKIAVDDCNDVDWRTVESHDYAEARDEAIDAVCALVPPDRSWLAE